MQTILTTIGGLRRSIEITLSYSELEPYFGKAYREVQSTLQLEGFRKGKVPIEIIKARFGKQIEQDTLSNIANEAFRTAAQEHDLDVIGSPVLVQANRTPEQGAHFIIEFEVMPDVRLVPYDQIEIVKPIRRVTDSDVEEELYNLQLRHAQLEEVDQVTDTLTVVKLRFSPVDPQTGAPLVGGKEQEFFLDDDRIDPILRSELLNLRTGDTFVYRTYEQGDDARPHEHVYHVTVQKIQKVVLPELMPDFITTVSTGTLSTLEQLQEDIRRSLEEYWDKEIANYLRQRLIDALIEAHEFDVPIRLIHNVAEEFINEALERHKDDKRLHQIPREQLIEYFLPQAEQHVRWQILADAILRNENITLEPAQLESLAQRYGVSIDQLKIAIKQNSTIHNRLLNDALFEFLLHRVRIVERPYEEVINQAET